MPFSNLVAPYSALRVCVDSAQPGRLSGLVYSQRVTAPIAFADMGALLLRLDEVLDKQNFPQAFQQARSFAAPRDDAPAADVPEDGLTAETVAAAHGLVATFVLYITSRRNSSWQGHIDWPDGSRQDFESALELIKRVEARIP